MEFLFVWLIGAICGVGFYGVVSSDRWEAGYDAGRLNGYDAGRLNSGLYEYRLSPDSGKIVLVRK